jgi:hypothetical protein
MGGRKGNKEEEMKHIKRFCECYCKILVPSRTPETVLKLPN